MRDHPQRNFRPRVEQPAARKIAVLVVDIDEVARPGVIGDLAEQAWKNRRLKREIFQLRPRLHPSRAIDRGGGFFLGSWLVHDKGGLALRAQRSRRKTKKPRDRGLKS